MPLLLSFMLKRIAKVSVYFYLFWRGLTHSHSHTKAKAYSFPMTGSKGQRPKQDWPRVKKKKKDWPTEKHWIVSDRPTTFQDSVGLSQNKIAYLITCHESLIRFSHPIPKHLKIYNFHWVYWYTFEVTTNFILLLFIYY